MKVELEAVQSKDRSILWNLLQLYFYDFSEIEPTNVGDDGLFGYEYFDLYWNDSARASFFVRVDGNLAGFAMVNSVVYLKNSEISVAEFFIMRKYRRQGVGILAAQELFRRFGRVWEIRTTQNNHSAKKFWLAVAKSSNIEIIQEIEANSEQWQGWIIQCKCVIERCTIN